MEINYKDIDWKTLLIKKYKNYNLDETDCMVLLVSDAILSIQDTLITTEILSPYMVNLENVDNSLSKLVEKKILVIENIHDNFISSLEGFKKKLFEDFIKDITLKTNNPTKNNDSLYSEIESICNRMISPLERDQISSWLKSGADEGMIKEGLKKSITKSGNVSFKNADKLILNMQRSKSRQDIGASTVNEETKKREELREFFVNSDWTYHGD